MKVCYFGTYERSYPRNAQVIACLRRAGVVVVEASAGGGMVTVDADGKGTITRVKIDPSVADPKDLEMLEDLVLVAVNEAQKKAAELAKEEMSKLTGGLNLPFKLPF